MTSIASGLDAKFFTQDPDDKKYYADVVKRSRKAEHLKTLEKNVRNKKGGSDAESFYKRSDAVVEVCGTLVDARGYEAGYDEAASDFGTYLNTD